MLFGVVTPRSEPSDYFYNMIYLHESCHGITSRGSEFVKNEPTVLPPTSRSCTDDKLWGEGDVIQLTLDCEACTLRIKGGFVDHTIPNLPPGQTWIPVVDMYNELTAVEILP